MRTTGYEVALERIEEAKRTGATELDLRFLLLREVPLALGELVQLEKLELGGNYLKEFPIMISHLTNLEIISFGLNNYNEIPVWFWKKHFSTRIKSNFLTTIPNWIGQLSNLSSLDISYNQLSALPEGIGQLSNLSSLSIHNNQLTALPDWIGQLSNLSSLDISYNQLSALPDWIGQLSNLSSLDISYNQLSALPDWIGQLSNLSSLNIAGNQLSALPDWIGQLSNLSSLNIAGNQLSALPDWIGQLSNLSSLSIHSNQLSALPDWIGQLSNLSSLDTSFNKLSALPDWIGQLSNLSSLDISYNQLSVLPDWIGQLSNLSSLNIAGNQLSTLPDGIGQLSNLSSLDIARNQLSTLPDGIGQLSNLSSLDIARNQLFALPDWIGQLSNLSSLDIAGNQLSALPDWIGQLSNLSSLDISYNQLSALPDWIGQLSNLSSLDIARNQLSALPDWIGQLSNLSFLDISGNQLSALPDWIGQLSNLSSLDISYNQLSALPDWIGQLSKLSFLDISDNQLSALPDWIGQLSNLSSLDIAGNQLSALPGGIGQLSNLSSLRIDENPLIDPPIEIAEQGIEAIRNYFEEKTKGFQNVYEAKLLIVGESGAGKTTLQWKILDINSDMPDEDDDSTRGIEIEKWEYTYNDHDFTVNIWDFGGQEIYKATHQFFMSENALYVLLADTRKEDVDYFDWLYRIEIFSGNSPVIIVHNEKDTRNKNIDINHLRRRFSSIDMPLACNLKEITENKSRKKEFEKILTRLKYEVSQLPIVSKKIPISYLSVRHQIEEKAKDGNNYISADEFYSICSENDLDKEKAKNLSSYFHEIGLFLHFQDDAILKNIVIINPEWGTKPVYKVIDTINDQKVCGFFEKEQLKNIWTEESYLEKFDELLQLMIRFKLCYEVRGKENHYIIPQILDYASEKIEIDGNIHLYAEYVYSDYYLNDIMVQFIVESHRWIPDENQVWRNGVILEKAGQKAYIYADKANKKIKIEIAGTSPQDLLITIMDNFEIVHSRFSKHLNYKIMIPCNCEACINSSSPTYYEYKNLKERINNNHFTVGCNKPPYTSIDIRQLLSYLKLDTYDNENINLFIKLVEGNKHFESITISDINSLLNNSKFKGKKLTETEILKLLENKPEIEKATDPKIEPTRKLLEK